MAAAHEINETPHPLLQNRSTSRLLRKPAVNGRRLRLVAKLAPWGLREVLFTTCPWGEELGLTFSGFRVTPAGGGPHMGSGSPIPLELPIHTRKNLQFMSTHCTHTQELAVYVNALRPNFRKKCKLNAPTHSARLSELTACNSPKVRFCSESIPTLDNVGLSPGSQSVSAHDRPAHL